jgi:hypothetical protein
MDQMVGLMLASGLPYAQRFVLGIGAGGTRRHPELLHSRVVGRVLGGWPTSEQVPAWGLVGR